MTKRGVIMLVVALVIGLMAATRERILAPEPIRGGIVPHHLLASSLIKDFFVRLGKQKPETIILIGPNHDEEGYGDAISSRSPWKTLFGRVEVDREVRKELYDAGSAMQEYDRGPIFDEHSLRDLMPFIKEHIPEAKVVPIMLSHNMSSERTAQLARAIGSVLDEKTVLIASIDFSHYLTSDEAVLKDETTLAAIDSFDYDRILKMNDDHLDSPPSLVVFLRAMQEVGATKQTLLHHTNSGELTGRRFDLTTSYFVFTYH